MGIHTDTQTCKKTTFCSLPRTRTLSTPAVAWYLPATQLVQEAELVCDVEPENLPASQSVQTEAPAAEYLPATQLVQMVDPAILCTHSITHNSVQFFASQHITITYVCVYQSRSLSFVREQVCVLHRVGLLKLTSMIGRFDTYKGGVYRMDSLMNPSSDMSDMFLVTGGKGGVCAFFFSKTQPQTYTHTQVIQSTGGTGRETA